MGFRCIIIDKLRASEETGTRGIRIPEGTLHLIELLGGWPGSLVAQYGMRHKTKKKSYRIAVALIIVAHALVVVVAWVAWGSWPHLSNR